MKTEKTELKEETTEEMETTEEFEIRIVNKKTKLSGEDLLSPANN